MKLLFSKQSGIYLLLLSEGRCYSRTNICETEGTSTETMVGIFELAVAKSVTLLPGLVFETLPKTFSKCLMILVS